MAVVIDSSVAACWAMPDEASEMANAALDLVLQGGMIVPALFIYELRNVLIVNERRGRIDARRTEEALLRILKLPHTIDLDFSAAHLMRLARALRLTVYDAAYVELAARMEAPLATLDRRLAEAAQAEGVQIL